MTMASKTRHIPDADPAVVLRARGAAIAASGALTGISLNALNEARWDNGEIPLQAFSAVVHVSSIVGAVTIEVEVADLVGFADPIVIGTLKPSKTGQHVINLDGPTIEAVNPGANFIRLKVTVAEDASINFESWLAPVAGQPV